MCEKTLFLAVCNSYVNCIGFYHINRKVSFMEVDQRSVLAGQQIECGRANLECSVAIVNFSLPVAQKSFTVHVVVGQAGLLTQSLFLHTQLAHAHFELCRVKDSSYKPCQSPKKLLKATHYQFPAAMKSKTGHVAYCWPACFHVAMNHTRS